ncbi:MAG: ATP-binding protein [Acidobacteriales bacterium]|nr:ATP-binding protein [Terriglobales bacterium]
MPSNSANPDLPAAVNFDPTRAAIRLKLSLAGERNAVAPVVDSVLRMIGQEQCLEGKQDLLELVLTEALANAVEHGAKGDASKVVHCEIACDNAQGIFIAVRDPGTGYDPSKIANPVHEENVLSEGGRGIFLITQLMDEVKFLNHGTEIQMVKR